ncbi:hypothetical protein H6G93_09300 [Nostoc sp. FACHB-973]|nr:hypothetical protein [Nostoc sp. FACHB-973]
MPINILGNLLTNPSRSGAYVAPTLWTPAVLNDSLWFNPIDALPDGSSWTDRNLGYVVTQPTAANRPTVEVSGLSGTPSLRFGEGGSNKFLSTPTRNISIFNGSPGLSVFAVNQYEAFNPGVTQRAIYLSDGIGNYAKFFTIVGSNSFQLAGKRADAESLSFSIVDPSINNPGDTFILGATHDYVNRAGTSFRNGVQAANSPTQFSAGTSDSPNVLLFLGNVNGSPTNSLIGRMGHIVIMPRVPSLVERQKLEGFLAWNSNLSSLLQVTHPYKNTPPTV